MLFDLRGRGRRRAVRVLYTGLALLMGVGLVGFGIGGGFGSGGLFNSLTSSEGANSASFASQITKYRKLTEKQPHSLSAWEGLTKNLLHEAGGEQYVTNSGVVTSKGKALFKQAAQAWSSYIALNPPKPNAELALLMRSVYSEAGLNEPAKGVQIMQLVVAAKPTVAAFYAELAEYAYKAHNTRVGDLASEKAVKLAPATARTRVKDELAEVKKNPSGEKTYTVTTNGKAYVGKLNSKGEFKATEVKAATTTAAKSSTSTTPAGKSSTTTTKK